MQRKLWLLTIRSIALLSIAFMDVVMAMDPEEFCFIQTELKKIQNRAREIEVGLDKLDKNYQLANLLVPITKDNSENTTDPVIASPVDQALDISAGTPAKHRTRHQVLLDAARSDRCDVLKELLLVNYGGTLLLTNDSPPTAYDMSEIFNAAFINRNLCTMQYLWMIPGLPDPVDFTYQGMNISHPHKTVPYELPAESSVDSPNDTFSFNLCSRLAGCDRWDGETSDLIFEFFKSIACDDLDDSGNSDDSEQEKGLRLINFSLRKAYVHNKLNHPERLQSWVDFICKKAKSQNCPAVLKALNELTSAR